MGTADQGMYGKRMMKRRGELIERSFAHMYETEAMRRTHLRGRDHIKKRLLVHASAFNLSLVLRSVIGKGTPRGLQGRKSIISNALSLLLSGVRSILVIFDNDSRKEGEMVTGYDLFSYKFFSSKIRLPLAA